MTEVVLRPASHSLTAIIETRFEEALYQAGLSFITSHLAAEATLSTYTLPSPAHLSILVTMLVHPSTTDTPLRRQAAHLLSRVLDVASPREAKLDAVWTFSRKRKRRADTSDDEEDLTELEMESLFVSTEGVWEVIEWAFHKGDGGWVDILNHIVRLLRNDFDECRARQDAIAQEAKNFEAIDESILVQWLRDSGRKAAFPKAIRAILATRGGELMLDQPKGIYEKTDTSTSTTELSAKGDIWDGSILLSHRIELLTMIYELSRLHPLFLSESHFLDALLRKLVLLDFRSLSSFLSNTTSLSLRTVLCESLAQQLSPEAEKAVAKLTSGVYLRKLIQYIRSLPPTGKEGATDLAKYCIIVGLIFRSWIVYTDGKEGCTELVDAVEEALQRRESRITSMKPADREQVGQAVRSEGRMLKLLALKLLEGGK